MTTQPESKVSADLRKGLEKAFPGSLWFKVHGSIYMRSGISDNLGCVEGRFIALEVKMKGNTLRPAQTRFLSDVLFAGGVGIVYTHTPGQPLNTGVQRIASILTHSTAQVDSDPQIHYVNNEPGG